MPTIVNLDEATMPTIVKLFEGTENEGLRVKASASEGLREAVEAQKIADLGRHGDVDEMQTVEQFKKSVYATLTPQEHELLDKLHEWDVDQNGVFSAQEVFMAAKEHADLHKEMHVVKSKAAMWRKAVFGIIVVSIILFAVMFGLMIVSNEVAKEVRVKGDNGATLTAGADGTDVVEVVAAKTEIGIELLPFMDAHLLSSVIGSPIKYARGNKDVYDQIVAVSKVRGAGSYEAELVTSQKVTLRAVPGKATLIIDGKVYPLCGKVTCTKLSVNLEEGLKKDLQAKLGSVGARRLGQLNEEVCELEKFVYECVKDELGLDTEDFNFDEDFGDLAKEEDAKIVDAKGDEIKDAKIVDADGAEIVGAKADDKGKIVDAKGDEIKDAKIVDAKGDEIVGAKTVDAKGDDKADTKTEGDTKTDETDSKTDGTRRLASRNLVASSENETPSRRLASSCADLTFDNQFDYELVVPPELMEGMKETMAELLRNGPAFQRFLDVLKAQSAAEGDNSELSVCITEIEPAAFWTDEVAVTPDGLIYTGPTTTTSTTTTPPLPFDWWPVGLIGGSVFILALCLCHVVCHFCRPNVHWLVTTTIPESEVDPSLIIEAPIEARPVLAVNVFKAAGSYSPSRHGIDFPPVSPLPTKGTFFSALSTPNFDAEAPSIPSATTPNFQPAPRIAASSLTDDVIFANCDVHETGLAHDTQTLTTSSWNSGTKRVQLKF